MARQNNFLQNSTNEFIVGATPWVTSSTVSSVISHTFTDSKISDDPTWVSQFVTVKNTGVSGTLTVGFTSLGITTHSHKFTIAAGSSYSAPFAVKEIFLSGAAAQPYEVIAGLTRIVGSTIATITQSNGYASV